MERKDFTFEDLEAWKYGRQLRCELAKLARGLPHEEKYRRADQIIRASRSVTNNIAEGYGRFHYRESIQFCRHSRGSLYELLDQLIICYDEGYMTEADLSRYKETCLSTIRLIKGYIRYLSTRKQQASK